jgi:cytidine deaminase
MSKSAELMDAALEARENAFAPYSGFPVGAAVRTKSGQIFTGCNVESSTYGLTVCAERIAIYKAVSEGGDPIVDVAVVADSPGPVAPCGACRQILWEQAPAARITCGNLKGETRRSTVKALLPHAFDSSSLTRARKKK